MITDHGDCPFECVDWINIPVDIELIETVDRETGEKDGTWTLRASNYTPLKHRIYEGAYKAVSESREELAELLRKHALPVYMAAFKQIQAICDNQDSQLSTWGNEMFPEPLERKIDSDSIKKENP